MLTLMFRQIKYNDVTEGGRDDGDVQEMLKKLHEDLQSFAV